MHAYRSHTCAQLNASNVGQDIRLSGWVKYPINKRIESAWKMWRDDISLSPVGLLHPTAGADDGATLLAPHFVYVREELEPFDGETAF